MPDQPSHTHLSSLFEMSLVVSFLRPRSFVLEFGLLPLAKAREPFSRDISVIHMFVSCHRPAARTESGSRSDPPSSFIVKFDALDLLSPSFSGFLNVLLSLGEELEICLGTHGWPV